MEINISQKLLYCTLFIVAGNGLISYAVYNSNKKINESAHWVQHTEQVISKSENILSLVKDIEVARQGFVITNDSMLLKPLYEAKQKVFPFIAQLRKLTNDNAVQQPRVDSLEKYMHQHLDFSKEIIEIRKKKGLVPAINYRLSKSNQDYNNNVSRVIRSIQEDEAALLIERKLINGRFVKISEWISIVLFVLMGFFTVVLIIGIKKYLLRSKGKENQSAEFLIVNKALAFQNEEKENRAAELFIANEELAFQNGEKEKRAAELITANEELAFQNGEKENRAAELFIANEELAFQNGEKEDRAAELITANEELAFQNGEKKDRAAELLIANQELAFQNEQKEKRAAELLIANQELAFQNKEKENRAAELLIANQELAFQNEQKENRAAELLIANKELAFQNKEKENRAAELLIANKELAFQNKEKENRAAELLIANMELAFQNGEKGNRAAELLIANEELAFQNGEKESRAAELLVANEELAFQNKEKEKRAAELLIANEELLVQNTEKEKIKQERIQSERKLARAQQIAHIGSWEFSFNTQFVFLSDESCRIYGLTLFQCQLSFDEWLSYIHPDDFEIVSKNIKKSRRSLENSFYFYRIVRPDGVIRYIYAESKVEFDLNGKPAGLYGIKQDVTEINIANENLRKSESRLKEAETIARLGNWEVELTNHTHTWSDEMHKILGTNNSETKPSSESFLLFIHPDDVNSIREIFHHSFKNFEGSSFEFRLIRKDGIIRYGYSEWKFEFDNNQNPLRIFGIIQDVTDRKLAEIERIKMLNDLVLHNKGLEQFAYIVSHNLRAPVANILGASSILNDPQISAENKEILNKGISESVLRLDNVIKDLNYILQIRSEINETKEKVVFSTLVSDINSSIQHMIDNGNIKIVCNFSEIDELLTVKSYMYSIFYNLISNSIKYRQPQVPSVITIKSYRLKNKITLLFADNGMGIDLTKKKDQVFGLYKRFHKNVEGKGMGLFMVKAQVETLGGKISLKSEVNNGTEFKIEFEK